MSDQKASCVHLGNTFFGTFEVVGAGPQAAVRVRYNGDTREARLDGLPADAVAHLLLKQLVMRDVAATLHETADRTAMEIRRRSARSR